MLAMERGVVGGVVEVRGVAVVTASLTSAQRRAMRPCSYTTPSMHRVKVVELSRGL